MKASLLTPEAKPANPARADLKPEDLHNRAPTEQAVAAWVLGLKGLGLKGFKV